MAGSWAPSRVRTATARASTSLSPQTSMNGTFSSWAWRILAPSFSPPVWASTRKPAAVSVAATSSQYALWRSPIEMTRAWTGASHTGNAPT